MTGLDSFSFGDNPELADDLLALVLAGKKTATCWAASEGLKGVEVGKRWIVNDGQGRPSAIIETVELTRRRFGEVDEGFAHDEGEGDQTLAWWLRAHTDYFYPARRVFAGHGALLRALPAHRGAQRRITPHPNPSPIRRGGPSASAARERRVARL